MSPGWITRHAANAVSGMRVALTPVFLINVGRAADGWSGGWPAAVLFGVIAISDFADGYVARRFGVASSGGRWLDHAADIGFVVPALLLYSKLGIVPWWVPAAVALSFAAYVADSWRRGPPGGWPDLIGSRVGHAAGVCNYALIGVLVGNATLGFDCIPSPVMRALFWLVPIYCSAAILTRFPALARFGRNQLKADSNLRPPAPGR